MAHGARRFARLPILRALGAQVAALALLVLLRALGLRLPGPAWLLLQGCGAALLAWLWGLGPWWRAFQIALPVVLALELRHPLPAWLPLVLLGLLALVFGGGLLTRVPLYNANRAAWEALDACLPEVPGLRVVDLGAGLGGPVAYLARRRPGAFVLGVEASPLVWLAGWLRRLPLRRNCRFRLGSLWKLDLAPFQVAYAFLAPPPMAELWAKARREMAPGSLLVSHTFEVPGQEPERVLPLPGRGGARLLLYRVS